MNISIRELAQQIAALSRRIDALSAPQLRRSSIEDGAIHEYDVDGNLVSIIGRQEDGSHGVVVVDGPDPLRTSTPIAEAGALTIAARWDGTFIDPDTGTVDASLPAYDDFKHIEVHVGDETGFHPDKNTLAGFIPNRDGGEVSVPAEAGTRYVRFVTRAISGKTSVPSIATEVEVATLVDPEQFELLEQELNDAANWIADSGATLDTLLGGENVIPEYVVDHLWANVVRAKQITTDMLLVGAGDNFVPDPNFVNDDLNAARLAASDSGWVITEDDGLHLVESQTERTFRAVGSSLDERFFQITPGHTYRVRYQRYTNRISILGNDFASSRPMIRWATIDGETATAYPRSTFQNAGLAWDYDEVEWTAPENAAGAYIGVQGTTGVNNKLFIRNLSVTSKSDASLIVDGAIAARHINAESIAAEIGEFIHVKADNIEAGTINAAIEIGVNGMLRVGPESGIHVNIANGMIESLRPGELGPQPAVTVGGSESAFRVYSDDGDFMGGILPDGGMVTPSLDAEEIRIGGEDIRAILDPRPKGVVVWSGYKDESRGSYTADRTGLYEVSFRAEGGRRYRLHFEARARTQNDAPYSDIGLTKTQTENLNEEAPAPLVTSPLHPGTTTLPLSGWFGPLSRSWFFKPNRTENARFLLWIGPNLQVRGFHMTVEDLGVNPENAGRFSLGGASGTVPDPTPPVQEYVAEIPFTAHQVWTQYGAGDTYAPQWVRGGWRSGMNGIYRTYLLWPTEFQNILSSAESIDRVEIRLGMVEGWAGYQVYTGLHNSSNIRTGAEPTIYNAAWGPSWDHQGQNKWFDLTASQVSAINSGRWGSRKGLSIGARTTSPRIISFYGTGASSTRRPMLRVHYTQ